MTALVTGVAGFIGSHVAEALLAAGNEVRGVDCLTDYYDPRFKKSNLSQLLVNPRFHLVEADLRVCDLEPLLSNVDLICHHAAQPGVRLSWAHDFSRYVSHNVLATQRLLHAAAPRPERRFIYASSSSVYGNAPRYPTEETALPQPHSPYGVTKLAGEHLCGVYGANYGLSTISLRYFTVYGPRQRPDMAFHRFIESALDGEEISLYGTGQQVRDFTYVADVVAAVVAAAQADTPPGTVLNIAAGEPFVLNDVISLLSDLTGREIRVRRSQAQPGDVERTGGSNAAARRLLGWAPKTALTEGLAAQVEWHASRRAPNRMI